MYLIRFVLRAVVALELKVKFHCNTGPSLSLVLRSALGFRL
jgi:hypothetical protein